MRELERANAGAMWAAAAHPDPAQVWWEWANAYTASEGVGRLGWRVKVCKSCKNAGAGA